MAARTALMVSFSSVVLMTTLGAAAPGPICSKQVLTIEDTVLTVRLCVPPGGPPGADDALIHVPVSESFTTKKDSFERTVDLDFLSGTDVSRSIDDVPLAKVGFPKATLHMTIAHTPDSIRLEHALLLPGAIPLK